ncbi:hypothetical protein H4W01_001146 [Sphingomonas sp. PL20]
MSKINDLANRCGINPVEADIDLKFVSPDDNEADCYYYIGAMDGGYSSDDAKVQKFWALLGLDDCGERRVGTLSEVDEIVDRALSLAPRCRTTDKKSSGPPTR